MMDSTPRTDQAGSAVTPDAEESGVSTLAQLLAKRGCLSATEVAEILGGVLDDLQAVHSRAEVHGDITSARIVLKDGRYTLTGRGAGGLGDVRYMSPERCQKRAPDSRSDIYSLGVVLYEAVTGRRPFDCELRHECIAAHINRPPDPPRLVSSEVSPELERVILRALSKNPAGRYQSVAEFRSALLDALEKPQESAVLQSGNDVGAAVESKRLPASRQRARFSPLVLVIPVALFVAGAAFVLLRGVRRMPDVRGKTLLEAKELLLSVGVDAVGVEETEDAAPAGSVVVQEPEPGSRVGARTAVVLRVSTGRIVVPELAGRDSSDAVEQLRRLGVSPVVETSFSDIQPEGRVIGTRPAVGSAIASGATVVVTVSGGRATCLRCGAARERGARFCVRCGFRF